jgi:hypothetical protein
MRGSDQVETVYQSSHAVPNRSVLRFWKLPDLIHADILRLKIKQSFAKKREATRAMTD